MTDEKSVFVICGDGFKNFAAADSHRPVLSGNDGADKQLKKEPVL